ncbi:MAG: VapC toxin family PIN domain ribonuclease [Candidatus Cloacimonadota bacterium]|nr:MAG: VapC toxin family PIN domain ribonuclease [Candidatus Cloacimonadota bacterium]
MTILTDSSVWIDYFNGVNNWQTNKLDNCLGKEEIVIGDLILAEVLRGFKLDKDYNLAKKNLMYLPILKMIDTFIAIKSADNFRVLRKKGITVRKTVDMIIGTYCIENNLYLLYKDRDFDVMEKPLGLKVLSS